MRDDPKIASTGKRLIAFIIDHIIFSFLSVVVFFVLLFTKGQSFDSASFSDITTIMNITLVVIFILYICKDFINGTSIGKRLVRITIRVADDTNITPIKMKLVLRNVFILIWPVEFIVLIMDKENRRIGDKIAKTCVVENPSNS